jgi:hypothetical protein
MPLPFLYGRTNGEKLFSIHRKFIPILNVVNDVLIMCEGTTIVTFDDYSLFIYRSTEGPLQVPNVSSCNLSHIRDATAEPLGPFKPSQVSRLTILDDPYHWKIDHLVRMNDKEILVTAYGIAHGTVNVSLIIHKVIDVSTLSENQLQFKYTNDSPFTNREGFIARAKPLQLTPWLCKQNTQQHHHPGKILRADVRLNDNRVTLHDRQKLLQNTI